MECRYGNLWKEQGTVNIELSHLLTKTCSLMLDNSCKPSRQFYNLTMTHIYQIIQILKKPNKYPHHLPTILLL